jgi:hypothetical protein
VEGPRNGRKCVVFPLPMHPIYAEFAVFALRSKMDRIARHIERIIADSIAEEG